MAFCGEASTWAKVALLLMVMALGIHATGYGTNYWLARFTVRDKLNMGIGLWRMTNCSGYYNAPCSDSAFPETYKDDKVKVTQAMESCALIVYFVATVCLGFYVGQRRSRTRGMAIAILTLAYCAAVLSITGMIVWLVYIPSHHYAGWSLGLTVFAITLSITAGTLLIPDIREYDYKDILKVGGEFNNLPVIEEEAPPPPPNKAIYKDDLEPIVIPQNPQAAPTFQYLQYDRRRQRDGF